MNPATNTTIIVPTIRYVLLEPPDPLLMLLFAKIFLFLVRGEIVAHAARFSEKLQNVRVTNHTANAASADSQGHHYHGSHFADRPVLHPTRHFSALVEDLG